MAVRACLLLCCLPLIAQSPLDLAVAKIASRSGGTVGVAAIHLESGRHFELRGSERFPMASVFKLPVAMALLASKTRPPLSTTIKIEASDLRPYRSPIAEHWSHSTMFTISDLLDVMLIESDNTSADALLRICGGGVGVNAYLHGLGIDRIRVDRGEGQMALDYAGVYPIPPESQWTLAWFAKTMAAVPRDQQRAAAHRFLMDERDTATPEAMVALLRALVQGNALSKEHTALVLDRMRKTVPGSARIKAGVPAGTVVAHRPGSGPDNEGITLCTNDVGVIDAQKGPIILAVFLKGSNKNTTEREKTIADITHAIFEAWK